MSFEDLLKKWNGGRLENAQAKNKTDVNFSDGTLNVFSPKTKRRRIVVMTLALAEHLRKYLTVVPRCT